jgi:RNA recognition motif-containing protein
MSSAEETVPVPNEETKETPVISSLYIGNLPFNSTSEDLKPIFEKYGPVKDVHIPRDYYSGRSKGFAYVSFESAADAQSTLTDMQSFELDGRTCSVELARGERKSKQFYLDSSRRRDDYDRRDRYDRRRDDYDRRDRYDSRRDDYDRRDDRRRDDYDRRDDRRRDDYDRDRR